MSVLHKVRHFFLPTHENVYRPPLLGKTSLVFFLALSLAVEGFLVAGLVAQQSDGVFLTQAPMSTSVQNTASVGESLHPLFHMPPFDIQTMANLALATIALLLVVGVLLAFFLHIDVQAHDMLLGALVVAAVALVCLVGNIYIL